MPFKSDQIKDKINLFLLFTVLLSIKVQEIVFVQINLSDQNTKLTN